MPPLLIVLTGLPHGCRTVRRSSSSVGSTPTDRDRQRWQDFATGRGMRHELVYLAADQSLLDTRRATAAATPDRHVLSTDVLQRVQRRFQPPAIATHTINANWPTPPPTTPNHNNQLAQPGSRVNDDDFRRAFRAMWRWSPNGGYQPLLVGAWIWPRPRQIWYQFRLRCGGRWAPMKDLDLLLDAGWRTSVAAIWLIAAGRRADMRPRIEREMLAGRPRGYCWSYCTPLACLGTDADARILVAYLDHALTLPAEQEGFETQCQAEALATLLYLDEQLGTSHAQQFLGDGGAWERWPGSPAEDLQAYLDHVRAEVLFAAGGDPGVRRRMREERWGGGV